MQEKSQILTGWLEKLIGLMGAGPEWEGEKILANKRPGAIMIHTFFMRFPLDIAIYDRNGVLLENIKNMKPWRIKFIWGKVYKIIERKSI